MNAHVRVLVALAGTGFVSSLALAQCPTPQWESFGGRAGVSKTLANINDTYLDVKAGAFVDHDSAGPHPGYMYFGGDFNIAGSGAASNFARYDFGSKLWEDVGGGTNGKINALLPLANGDVLVAGAFTVAGGAPANRIARWTGTAWQTLGAGISNGLVNNLTQAPDGTVVVSGVFSFGGGVSSACIIRYNPTTNAWSALGSGIPVTVNAVAVRPNGNIIAAREDAGPSTAALPAPLMEWNGTSWSPLGTWFPNGAKLLALLPNGDVLTDRTDPFSSFRSISRWNGSSWTLIEVIGTNESPLVTMSDGVVFWGSHRWTGTAFVPDAAAQSVFGSRALQRVNGGYYFTNYRFNHTAGLSFAADLATQSLVSHGISVDFVQEVLGLPDGSTVLAGPNHVGSLVFPPRDPAAQWMDRKLVRLAGDTWEAVPLPVSTAIDIGDAGLAYAADGSLLLRALPAGSFEHRLYKQTSTGWATGSGNVGPLTKTNGVGTLRALSDGRVAHLSGGEIKVWNGFSSFQAAAPITPLFGRRMLDLTLRANGNFVVGLDAFDSQNGVWELVNGTWTMLGSGIRSSVARLQSMPNGSLLISGPRRTGSQLVVGPLVEFTTDWQSRGAPLASVLDFGLLPAGELVLFGKAANSATDDFILAVENGSAWATYPLTLQFDFTNDARSVKLHVTPTGDAFLYGPIVSLNGQSARQLVRLRLSAPCVLCDSLDFNGDSLLPDDTDLIDFLSVLAGGECSTGVCNDIDFNNDGLFPDDNDLVSFLRVLAGGPC